MATTTSQIEIWMNKDVTNIINAKQMDSNSRYLQITLLQDDGTAYDLTDHTARFNALKQDLTHVFNDCVMTDPANGIITVELTDQTLAIGGGKVTADISVFNSDGTEVLTTRTFDIEVQTSLLNAEAIESSDEYGAVVTLFQDVWDLRDYIRSIGHYYDDVAEGDEPASYTSLWGAFNVLYAWMQTQSTAAMATDISTLLTRVGTPSTFSTLVGYLNSLYTNVTAIAGKSIITNGSAIKSRQSGTLSFASSTSSTRTVSVSSVDTTKAALLVEFGAGTSGNVGTMALTSATEITQTYSTGASGTYTFVSVSWTLIEFV